MDRQVLRRILLGELGDRVAHGKRLRGFAEEADGSVTARFADGTQATGAVLVGADGGNSVVRRRLVPEVGLVDSDLCGAMGRTSITDRFLRLMPGRGTMVKGPEITLMLGRMQFGRPVSRATLLGDAAHLTLASGGNGANTAMQDAVRLCARLAEVDRGERDLTSALGEYQDDLLERGNAAVEFGKEALKRFVRPQPRDGGR